MSLTENREYKKVTGQLEDDFNRINETFEKIDADVDAVEKELYSLNEDVDTVEKELYSLNEDVSSMIDRDVPVGTIIWFHLDLLNEVPENYWICDGSIISDNDSPLNGLSVPDFIDGDTIRSAMSNTGRRINGDFYGVSPTYASVFGRLQSRHYQTMTPLIKYK